MTNIQIKRFQKLCREMSQLLADLRSGEHPHACLFIEDGSVNLFDWPPEIERRPEEPMCFGSYWDGASGGGR
jgi:hypothetical protein